jgi:endogenous inhibitor of DNA gyrase (YacG/DUF329 family)
MSKKHKHYWEVLPKDTSAEGRKAYNTGNIWKNAVKCLLCGEEVRSNNRRDFRYCSCKNIAVDGGSWYLRRIGPGVNLEGEDTYEERSEYFDKISS